MRIYAKLLHVSNYYLFDPMTGVLEGYELDSSSSIYRSMQPAPDGDLPCPALGLRLGVRHGHYQGIEADWLRWIDVGGRVLPSAEEDALAAEQKARSAEARAGEQARQREETERRLAEALAEIERLKASAGR
jgi:hypothetical protein